MGRVLVAVAPDVGVSPSAVAAGWDDEENGRALGTARLEVAPGGEFLPGPAELVLIPVAVNLASSVLYDVVRRLVWRAQSERGDRRELELAEVMTGRGDRVVVVRLAREGS